MKAAAAGESTVNMDDDSDDEAASPKAIKQLEQVLLPLLPYSITKNVIIIINVFS